jgi:hypothetical protein
VVQGKISCNRNGWMMWAFCSESVVCRTSPVKPRNEIKKKVNEFWWILNHSKFNC